jgi:uncharacterized protein (DUF2461 family)
MSISPALVQFMAELADNNNREWFAANKKRYERDVKEASLAFISEFGEVLPAVAPHIEAIAKVQGGSLFRIYRRRTCMDLGFTCTLDRLARC